MKTIQDVIRTLRVSKGYTQETVAWELGMSTNGYNNYERGVTEISVNRLDQIGKLYGLTASQLLDLRGKNINDLIKI